MAFDSGSPGAPTNTNIQDSPIVDSTAGRAFVFANANPSGQGLGSLESSYVVQNDTMLSSGSQVNGLISPLGTASTVYTAKVIHTGTFDNLLPLWVIPGQPGTFIYLRPGYHRDTRTGGALCLRILIGSHANHCGRVALEHEHGYRRMLAVNRELHRCRLRNRQYGNQHRPVVRWHHGQLRFWHRNKRRLR